MSRNEFRGRRLLRDLRATEISKKDLVNTGGKITGFLVKVNVSFKYNK
jgi:hypothetical protein